MSAGLVEDTEGVTHRGVGDEEGRKADPRRLRKTSLALSGAVVYFLAESDGRMARRWVLAVKY